ncbi:MAG: LPS-assembly protein LptD [bacterium]
MTAARHRWRPVFACTLVLIAAGPLVRPVRAQEDIPVILRARTFQYDRVRRIMTASGNVVVIYQDVTIRSDAFEARLETNDVHAEGNVIIEVNRQRVRGATLDYNLVSRQGRITQAAAQYTGPQVLGTVSIRAEVVEGTLGGVTTARESFCTTCEGPNPVAYLTAREFVIYPNDKIVGRSVTVWIGGRRIFTWPYFVIFIREQRASRLLPVIGYSETEGFFIKTAYSYALGENHYGYLRLDLMEKLGTGYGVEHAYRLRSGEGVAFFYRLENKALGGQDTRFTINHQHRVGDVALRLYADTLTRTTPLAPSSDFFTSLDSYYRGSRSSTTFYQTYSSRSFTGFGSQAYTARLIHSQQFSNQLSAELVADVSRTTTFLGTDDELFPRLTLRYRGSGYTAYLVAEGRIDIDGSAFPNDVRFVTERLPEVSVILDSKPIGGTRLFYQLEGGLGRFRETQFTGVVDALRADGGVTVTGSLYQSAQGILNLRAQVRGSSYSTGHSRTFLTSRLDYTHTLSQSLQGQVGISYQDQVGATPFTFDLLSGRVAQADATLTYRQQNLAATATVSFDALFGRWSPLVARAQYIPLPGWTIASAIAYDPNLGLLSRAELSFDIRLSPDWQVAYYGFYDGFSGQIVHDRFMIARTWEECLVTAVTYRGLTREVWFETWLTALPWARGQIGIGSQGNLLFNQPFPFLGLGAR